MMSNTNNFARETIRVGGLRSDEGGKEIEHNLIQVDGVREAVVSLEQRAVTVDYDPTVISVDYIRRTLDSLGYSPYIRN